MKKRLFIAINLPGKTLQKLSDYLADLRRNNQGQPIRWVKPEGLHITLHFLGSLDEQKTKEVKAMLKQVVGKHSQTDLEYFQLAGFPDLKQLKVVVLKCQENRILSDLQKEMKKELERLRIETDDRLWQPHITLGRAKGEANLKVIEIGPDTFEVPSVELMESHLDSTGAEYEIVESYLLKC